MTGRRLALLPLGEAALDPGLAGWLVRELSASIGAEVREAPPAPLRPEWRDGSPDRYHADAILDALIPRDGADETSVVDEWVLALTDADLTAPGRPYVFGEATVGGAWAVVGLARLASPELGLFRLRALKEALHEVGHLAGLGHCPRAACVMRESTTVDDTDRKPADFCAACLERLGTQRQP